jgi:hypothetical protein
MKNIRKVLIVALIILSSNILAQKHSDTFTLIPKGELTITSIIDGNQREQHIKHPSFLLSNDITNAQISDFLNNLTQNKDENLSWVTLDENTRNPKIEHIQYSEVIKLFEVNNIEPTTEKSPILNLTDDIINYYCMWLTNNENNMLIEKGLKPEDFSYRRASNIEKKCAASYLKIEEIKGTRIIKDVRE